MILKYHIQNINFKFQISQPTGLTVDVQSKRLYWCDQHNLSAIESISYDGTNRLVVLKKSTNYISQPYSIQFYNNYIYWLDSSFKGGSISKVHIDKGKMNITHLKI